MGHRVENTLWPFTEKFVGPCSIDMHLKKPTNKVNSIHHGLVDTCPNLSFLGELHLRLRYDEKIHCLQVKTLPKRGTKKANELYRAVIQGWRQHTVGGGGGLQ